MSTQSIRAKDNMKLKQINFVCSKTHLIAQYRLLPHNNYICIPSCLLECMNLPWCTKLKDDKCYTVLTKFNSNHFIHSSPQDQMIRFSQEICDCAYKTICNLEQQNLNWNRLGFSYIDSGCCHFHTPFQIKFRSSNKIKFASKSKIAEIKTKHTNRVATATQHDMPWSVTADVDSRIAWHIRVGSSQNCRRRIPWIFCITFPVTSINL